MSACHIPALDKIILFKIFELLVVPHKLIVVQVQAVSDAQTFLDCFFELGHIDFVNFCQNISLYQMLTLDKIVESSDLLVCYYSGNVSTLITVQEENKKLFTLKIEEYTFEFNPEKVNILINAFCSRGWFTHPKRV